MRQLIQYISLHRYGWCWGKVRRMKSSWEDVNWGLKQSSRGNKARTEAYIIIEFHRVGHWHGWEPVIHPYRHESFHAIKRQQRSAITYSYSVWFYMEQQMATLSANSWAGKSIARPLGLAESHASGEPLASIALTPGVNHIAVLCNPGGQPAHSSHLHSTSAASRPICRITEKDGSDHVTTITPFSLYSRHWSTLLYNPRHYTP